MVNSGIIGKHIPSLEETHVRYNYEILPKLESIRYHFVVVDKKQISHIMTSCIYAIKGDGHAWIEPVRSLRGNVREKQSIQLRFFSLDSNSDVTTFDTRLEAALSEIPQHGIYVKRDARLLTEECNPSRSTTGTYSSNRIEICVARRYGISTLADYSYPFTRLGIKE
jgi:hypothetical protein